MTEVRGLCSASYREVDPKCTTKTNAGGETFDAPFLSVLDRFTDAATKCSLTLVTSSSSSSSWPPSSNDALRLLLRHVLEASYGLARIYFRVITTNTGTNLNHDEIVDHQELHKFVRLVLSSVLGFFDDTTKEPLTVRVRIDGTGTEHSVRLFAGIPQETILKFLEDVVWNTYDRVALENDITVPSFLEPSLVDLSLQEYHGFFSNDFLNEVKLFLDDPTTTTPTATPDDKEDNDSSDKQSSVLRKTPIVESKMLSHCLWHYYDMDMLLTDSCSVAMEEATTRIQELVEQKKEYHRQQEHQLDGGMIRRYLGVSVLVVGICSYFGVSVWLVILIWDLVKNKKGKGTTRLLRQCLLVNAVVSIFLWLCVDPIAGGSSLGHKEAYLDAGLVCLFGFLIFSFSTVDSQHDSSFTQEEEAEKSRHRISYELPLLNESSGNPTTLEEGTNTIANN